MRPSPRIPPMVGLTFGILSASTAAIFIRFALEYAPPLVIAAYRLGLAVLLLTPIVVILRRNDFKKITGRGLFLMILSGIFLAIHFASWITSLSFTSVASSVVLVTSVPLWVALFSPFTTHERMQKVTKIGMVIALFGAMIIGISDSCSLVNMNITCPPISEFVRGKAFIGDLLALLGAIMAACYLLVGRTMRDRTSLISYIYIVYGVAAILLILMVVLLKQPLTGYSPIAFLWFFLLALIPQLLGHSSFNWALRYLSAGVVSIALLGEPIGSTILAFLILNEKPTILKIIGGGIILTGIVIASRQK